LAYNYVKNLVVGRYWNRSRLLSSRWFWL